MTNRTKSRLSIDVDPALHRALKIAAVENGTTLQEVALEAFRAWLRRHEDHEDAAAIAKVEHEDDVPWGEVQADLDRKRAGQPVDEEASGRAK